MSKRYWRRGYGDENGVDYPWNGEDLTDAEVLAKMDTDDLLDEVQRRGYGIIYRGREDPDFDMEKGLGDREPLDSMG